MATLSRHQHRHARLPRCFPADLSEEGRHKEAKGSHGQGDEQDEEEGEAKGVARELRDKDRGADGGWMQKANGICLGGRWKRGTRSVSAAEEHSCRSSLFGTHQLEAKGVAKAHEQAGLQRRQQPLEQHPAGPEGERAAHKLGRERQAFSVP